MIKKVQLVNQQYRVKVPLDQWLKKAILLVCFLESKTTTDEVDENSLPKSKRIKREEEGSRT